MKSQHLFLLAAASAILSLSACKKVPVDTAETADAGTDGAASSKDTLGAVLSNTGDFSSLNELIRAADLDTTLAGPGPYTVFAPSNAAIEALPAEAVKTLKTDAAKPQLTGLITGHIIPGTVTLADLGKAIDAGGGKAELKTMAGDALSFARDGNTIAVTAPGGEPVRLTGKSVTASNGVAIETAAVLMRGT